MLLGMTRPTPESRVATFLAAAGALVTVLDLVAAFCWRWHGPADVVFVLLLLACAGVEAVSAFVATAIASSVKTRPVDGGARVLLWIAFAMIVVAEFVGVFAALAAWG